MTGQLHRGDRIGIVSNSLLYGTVTARNLIFYFTEDEFRMDANRHLVPEGSRYWFDEKKGKIGIELSDPMLLDSPIQLEKMSHASGFRIV